MKKEAIPEQESLPLEEDALATARKSKLTYIAIISIFLFVVSFVFDNPIPPRWNIYAILINNVYSVYPIVFTLFFIFLVIKLGIAKRTVEHIRHERRNAYGAKGWAGFDDVQAAPHISIEQGVWIGGNWFWQGKGHMLTVGSSRAGKGVNLVVPCLLSPGFAASGASFICLDPKGENAHVTRRSVAGAGFDTHVLNPFGISGLPNACFNPFDLTSADDLDVIAFCDMLAEMLVPLKSNADATAEYFDDQARTLLSAFMLHMLDAYPAEANFGTLFRWVHLTGDPLFSLLSEMATSSTYNGVVASLIGGFIETRTSGGEKEASGVLSSARRALVPFKNPRLVAATSSSDFDLREIAQRQTGLYVCIPQSEMSRNAVWLRLVMGTAMKVLQKHYNPKRKVLFILDEFATLGYMRDFEENEATLAGYNVTFWPIIQLIPQLQNLYSKVWESFIGNAHIKHFIGIGDNTTAEYVSKMMPNNTFGSSQVHGHVVDKKLLEPDEVQAFPGIITFIAGIDRPTWFEATPYFEHPTLKDRADPNPMHS